MMGILSSNAVGWILRQAGLCPFSLDTDMFQIVREGENYIVHTDRLPEIYLEKVVTLDLFEYREELGVVWFAMDKVNARRTPVVVFYGEVEDAISFRVCLSPESPESLSDNLNGCFITIEQAIEAFGHACEMGVKLLEE